jgi:hypothetical protein
MTQYARYRRTTVENEKSSTNLLEKKFLLQKVLKADGKMRRFNSFSKRDQMIHIELFNYLRSIKD